MLLNRVTLVLVLLAVAIQSAVLYKQFGLGRSKAAPPAWRDANSGSTLEIEGLPTLGTEDAQLVLTEFSDYECPYCIRHAKTVEPEIRQKFVDSGKIKYVFANNPLAIHQNAEMLAVTAYCAGEQGSYWEMHDALFASQPTTEGASRLLAKGVVSDYVRFEECFRYRVEARARITSDKDKAQKLGLTGTPAFALGKLIPGKPIVRIVKVISGAAPLSTFESAINDVSTTK